MLTWEFEISCSRFSRSFLLQIRKQNSGYLHVCHENKILIPHYALYTSEWKFPEFLQKANLTCFSCFPVDGKFEEVTKTAWNPPLFFIFF